MGAGKSSVGRLLAEALGLPFHDTDAHVEERAGRSIDAFFPEEEATFRRLEAEAVAELVARGPALIALGGGALMNAETLALLQKRALLVHLYVPWADARSYLPALMDTRPLLRGRSLEEIRRLYEARLATYRQAELEVSVGRAGPEAAAAAVLEALKRHQAGV